MQGGSCPFFRQGGGEGCGGLVPGTFLAVSGRGACQDVPGCGAALLGGRTTADRTSQQPCSVLEAVCESGVELGCGRRAGLSAEAGSLQAGDRSSLVLQ